MFGTAQKGFLTRKTGLIRELAFLIAAGRFGKARRPGSLV